MSRKIYWRLLFRSVALAHTAINEVPRTACSREGPGVIRAGVLPSFLGVLVKVPFTVRQWELSPPQTPHLSSTLLEPISLSQPTFWGKKIFNVSDTGVLNPSQHCSQPFTVMAGIFNTSESFQQPM